MIQRSVLSVSVDALSLETFDVLVACGSIQVRDRDGLGV